MKCDTSDQSRAPRLDHDKPRRSYWPLWLAALLAGGLSLFLWMKHEQSRADALITICWNIGNDLTTNTNSERIAIIDHWSSTNFSAFVVVPARIQAIKLGDNPIHFLRDSFEHQAHATGRPFFTNRNNKHFEIRIRGITTTSYTVIGAAWD